MGKLISKQCVDFVKSFEGFYPTPYYDLAHVKTLGYGMTGKEIQGLTRVTEKQASNMLEYLLDNKYALPIKGDLDRKGIKLTQNQFDALVSMAYNIGVGGVLGSTLYKNICNGIRDKAIITANFQSYSNAGGKRIEGLYRRRTEEAEMFFSNSNTNISSPSKRYTLEFQKWYNQVTKTKAPLSIDGSYGQETEKCFNSISDYIRKGSKYKYCLEFQKWYNNVTQTRAPLIVDGTFGPNTEKALKTISNIIKEL